MIKITFEGANLHSVLLDMRAYLMTTAAVTNEVTAREKDIAADAAELAEMAKPAEPPPVEKAVEKPVEKPVEKLETKPGKTGKQRSAAQIAADKERMAKMRAKRGKSKPGQSFEDQDIAMVRAKDPAMAEKMEKIRATKPVAEEIETTTEFAPPGVLFPKIKVPEPKPPVTDPIEIARIRQKTISDLQEAYANGKQQEVFELLGRFGNGAKSFRELTPEAFLPIREAIDNGGLT